MKTKTIKIISAILSAIICAAALFSCESGAPDPVGASTEKKTEKDTGKETETVAKTVTEAICMTEKYDLNEGGRRFYFSSEGSDSDSGDSENSPWKSLSKLSGVTLRASDRVLLRRGDVFNERLVIRGKGEENAWIFVGAYGDPEKPAPCISLGGGRDDIAILCDDGKDGLGYIWIDGLQIGNSCLGIYFRFDQSTDNRGIRVTDCSFENINCPELMTEALTDVSFLAAEKAGLDNGGGAYEYIWPTAINIGGRPKLPLAAVKINGVCAPSTVVSDIEIERCTFDSCVIGVGANCYSYHYGMGENQFREYTKNWSVQDLYSKNTMTAFNFDACSFGYDGTENSRYGIFENIICDGGMENYTMSFGTTLALLSSCCDLYIKNSRFSGCKNNGRPDGCGFDFERDDHNITLDHCVIDNNEGQGVLVMDTVVYDQVSKTDVHTPNTGCKIINCLFYNNMTNVYNGNYKYDVLVFNRENTDFTVSDNTFCYRETTNGKASVRINKNGPVGAVKKGFTIENNKTYSYKTRSDMPDIETLIR